MKEHVAQRKGRTLGRVGLMMTLWLDPSAQQRSAWQAVLEVADRFGPWSGLQQAGWWTSTAVSDSGWFSTMGLNSADPELAQDSADALLEALHDSATNPPNLRTLAAATTPKSGLFELALGSGPANESAWSAPLPWLMYANVPPQGGGVAGFVRIHADPGAVDDEGFVDVGTAASFSSFLRAAVGVLPVLHGTAGFGLQLPLSFRHFRMNLFDAVALYPLVERFSTLR